MVDTERSSVFAGTDSTDFDDREVDMRSVEELEEEIAELCAHIDAATYRLLRAIAELDRREAWAVGFQSTAHWLSWKVGIDLVTAREKVRVGRALERLPRISDTFRQGKMSYSKVRAMTRIATPENEAYLLYIAENGTACHMERLVRAYRRASRGEDPEEARRRRDERYLEMYTDDDGMVVIRGRLPQEVGALVQKALNAAMEALGEEEEQKEEEERDGGCPDGRSPSRASAESSEACGQAGLRDSAESSRPNVIPVPACGGTGSSGVPSAPVLAAFADNSAESSTPSVIAAQAGIPWPLIATGSSGASAESWRQESSAQRRVDALGLLAEAALGKGLEQTERGEPYQVMIHVDAEVLAGRFEDGRSQLDSGEGIPAESCRRLACDAPHATVAQDTEGNLLHIGRKARKISTPLWRALMIRDGTCRFPGCRRTRHLQAHHIEHWAKGGETNPDNLLLLCPAHHWAVHEGGLRVEGRTPHGLVFRRPDGSLLPVCPVRVPINGDAGETLKEANRRHGLEITAKTVDSFWDGGAMDYHMAVDALLSYDDDPIDRE